MHPIDFVPGQRQGARSALPNLRPFPNVFGVAHFRCCIGVCFRAYTVEEANKLGVTGFVKNASDGTVSVRAPSLNITCSLWPLGHRRGSRRRQQDSAFCPVAEQRTLRCQSFKSQPQRNRTQARRDRLQAVRADAHRHSITKEIGLR